MFTFCKRNVCSHFVKVMFFTVNKIVSCLFTFCKSDVCLHLVKVTFVYILSMLSCLFTFCIIVSCLFTSLSSQALRVIMILFSPFFDSSGNNFYTPRPVVNHYFDHFGGKFFFVNFAQGVQTVFRQEFSKN